MKLEPFRICCNTSLMSRRIGGRQYELKDHLRRGIAPNVLAYSSYYPFGMQMPSRTANTEKYRFGFGGHEKDDEISGAAGGHLAFKYRIHDARLGGFFSVDPLTKNYLWNSPYAFSENDVIRAVELEGLEKMVQIFGPDAKPK